MSPLLQVPGEVVFDHLVTVCGVVVVSRRTASSLGGHAVFLTCSHVVPPLFQSSSVLPEIFGRYIFLRQILVPVENLKCMFDRDLQEPADLVDPLDSLWVQRSKVSGALGGVNYVQPDATLR